MRYTSKCLHRTCIDKIQRNKKSELTKNHFIAGFSTTDPDLPIIKCDRLISQCAITLDLYRNSRVNPGLSSYAYLFGPYDFHKSHMELPGTRMIVHEKPGNRTSWVHNVTPGWYIGLSLDHYRFMQCYMHATGIVRITDTLQYTPNTFAFPTTTTEDYLHQAI